MYNSNEPDIFSSDTTTSDLFKEAQADIASMTEDKFQYHYKATKSQYTAIMNAICDLQKANEALQEMSALNVDSEISESTVMLIEDYTRLLDQMHSANYWEREGI
jgi:hypothetical protein